LHTAILLYTDPDVRFKVICFDLHSTQKEQLEINNNNDRQNIQIYQEHLQDEI
jgi:hypothetical protein